MVHETPPELIDELMMVDNLAEQLADFLAGSIDKIAQIHAHGAGSKLIQDHVATFLRAQLGFDEEVVLTKQSGFVTQARPDFFYRLSVDRGIIAEVERGGTITNNHDLKDMWKAHIAPDAHHLFLVVPLHNFKVDGRLREKPFQTVSRRLGAFFGDPRTELDVLSAHIFAY